MARPLILAPAGTSAAVTAAVRCGADAVYLGAKNFNARRNAENFDETSLRSTVEFCHQRGAQVFVTVNTLVRDAELPALEATADEIAEAGADAVIVQDMAVMRLFAERYPDLPRHASTQTAVHDLDGARYLEDLGYRTVVLARELTLAEMEYICSRVSARCEAFVHGAHCMSLSGACYLSAMLGGRSGNRGLCAQPCRLDWQCGGEGWALSLKDMSLLSHVREMERAGVGILKIEGRMKRPEYVAAAVTACLMASTNYITAPSISLEGRTLWILRSLPVSAWDVLVSKLMLHLLVTEIGAVFFGAVVSVVLGFPIPELLLVCAVALALGYIFGKLMK